jgi:hypothetical protein
MQTNSNHRHHAHIESNKRRKTSTRNNHVDKETSPTYPCVANTDSERALPRPHMIPKIVLSSSVLADVYAHNTKGKRQNSVPLSHMFSPDGSTDLKSTLLNNTTLSIQFSSCILPARDDIQLVCRT